MKLYQSGQVLIITIFILGLVAIAMVMSMATTGVGRVVDSQTETTGEGALYASKAGIEEILYRLGNDANFGNGSPTTIQSTTLGSSNYVATISGNAQVRYATASGTLGTSIKKISISLSASASAGNVVLAYAIQGGGGGITMNSNTTISGKNGADGNVYSNGVIQSNSNSSITGNVWAVGGINPGGGQSDRLTVTKNAYGSVINNCTVNGNTYSPVLPTNCVVSGTKTITPAPTPLPLPNVDTNYWRSAATNGGVISGNYTLSTNASLGPKEITGDMTLNGNAVLTLTGPLWVHGTFTMNGNSQLILADSFGVNGTVILLDHPTDKANQGILVLNSNAAVKKNTQGGYILFVSTNQTNNCTVAAATFNSNSSAAGIVAKDGCVHNNSNSNLISLAARQIVLDSNTQITYETGLSSELYLPGPGVGGSGGNFGWTISSWKEIP